MKTILLHCLALFALSESGDGVSNRKRRGYFRSTYPKESNQLNIAGISVENFGKANGISLNGAEIFRDVNGNIVSVPEYSKPEVTSQHYHIPELNQIPQIGYASSNAVDKPVQESQEFIPPQATGTVIIPRRPPPAIPVNAIGLNAPGNSGAVFLGSGALGVLDLGGGAYALGSGAIGYSERRSNPRSSFKAPLLPPVQAAPNLIPAAVNSPQPPQQTSIFEYQFPVTGQLPTDQNGYEYLPPNRVGFGDPLPIRPLKTRNAYATLSPPQLPSQPPVYPPLDPSQSMQQHQPIQPEFIQATQILQTTESVTSKDANRADVYGQDVLDLYSSSYLK